MLKKISYSVKGKLYANDQIYYKKVFSLSGMNNAFNKSISKV